MDPVTFEIPLVPTPKGRPRLSRATGQVYTPRATSRFEADVAMVAAAHLPRTVIEGPVRVDLLHVLPRPARLMRRSDPDGLVWAPVKPDRDNLDKAVIDALRAIWRDDAQIVCGESLKTYAERTGRPRVVVRIASAGRDPGLMAAWLGLDAAGIASARVGRQAP